MFLVVSGCFWYCDGGGGGDEVGGGTRRECTGGLLILVLAGLQDTKEKCSFIDITTIL